MDQAAKIVRNVRELEVALVELEPDGVIVITFVKGARLTEENTMPVVQALVDLGGGSKRPVLADIRGMHSADQKSRQLGNSPEMKAVVSHFAILVGNPLTRVIANFFLSVTKPHFPARLFSDEQQARAWLMAHPNNIPTGHNLDDEKAS